MSTCTTQGTGGAPETPPPRPPLAVGHNVNIWTDSGHSTGYGKLYPVKSGLTGVSSIMSTSDEAILNLTYLLGAYPPFICPRFGKSWEYAAKNRTLSSTNSLFHHFVAKIFRRTPSRFIYKMFFYQNQIPFFLLLENHS